MAPRTRGVAALHLLPETPNPDSVGARGGVGGWCHWRTPVQHFTSARFGLAVRTAAPGTQVLPTRAPPVPGVPGSLRPLPQGTLHSPGRAPQPRAHTGPGPLQPAWIPRVSSQHRGGERGARACVPCSRSASPFWLLRGGNHTSFRRSRWKRIQGTQRSLQPNAAARLLFIETGRSAAGRGGPARAAGTRFLASRARQGVRAGRA